MVKIRDVTFTKPKDWGYSIGNNTGYIGKGTLHFFTKQIHPQSFIGIVISEPIVYDGYYRITIKQYYLKHSYYDVLGKSTEIPLELIHHVTQLEEIDNPYPSDVKRFILQSFKKYGKVIERRK